MTDDHPVIPWLTQPRRAWLYRVLGALAVLAAALGVATEPVIGAVLAVAVAIIGNGVAAINTPRD